MMKNFIMLAVTAICVIVVTQVSNAQITGSKHDLSSIATGTTEKCVFCHTPHSQSATQVLWNRTASGATYTMYSSTTMEQSASAPGEASKMCLSCHDGTLAYNSLINLPGSGASGSGPITTTPSKMTSFDSLGTDLSNDHPVGIIYNTSQTNDAGLRAATAGINGHNATVAYSGNTLPLSGSALASATVECTSCHDPHKTTIGEFMRISNAGSQMCLTCHNK